MRVGCLACHGIRGAGGHPNNNVKGGAVPALDAVAGTYTTEELEAKIRRGAVPLKDDPEGAEPLVRMPAWGGVLAPNELADVAAYVRSLAKSEDPDGEW